MKASLERKLEQIVERFEELAALLSDPNIINNQDMFRRYSQEYAEIEPVVNEFGRYTTNLEALAQTKLMLEEPDEEIRALAEEELRELQEESAKLDAALQILLLPKDPNDGHNVFLEIRAGTGGDEAAIFAGDLLKMYLRYAETSGWKRRSSTSAKASTAATKRSSHDLKARRSTAISSSNQARIGFSAFLKPNPKAEFILLPVPSLCCQKLNPSTPLRSTRGISGLTLIALVAQVVSTLTKPILQCG